MRLTWLHNRNVNSDSDEVEMSRLIDADKLKAHYAWWKGGGREMTMDEAKNDFDTIIDLQPTVEPTKHGRWVHKYGDGHEEPAITGGECSICGYIHTATNYCPNCGAKMTRWKNE